MIARIASDALLALQAPKVYWGLKNTKKLYAAMLTTDESARTMHELVDKFIVGECINFHQLRMLLSSRFRYSLNKCCWAEYKKQQDNGRQKILSFFDLVLKSPEYTDNSTKRDALFDLLLFSLAGCIENSNVLDSLSEGSRSPYAPAWLKERVKDLSRPGFLDRFL